MKEDKAISDLESIPIVKNQEFKIVQLGKNLRNSGQILDHSYKIQEESIIESAILQVGESIPRSKANSEIKDASVEIKDDGANLIHENLP